MLSASSTNVEGEQHEISLIITPKFAVPRAFDCLVLLWKLGYYYYYYYLNWTILLIFLDKGHKPLRKTIWGIDNLRIQAFTHDHQMIKLFTEGYIQAKLKSVIRMEWNY